MENDSKKTDLARKLVALPHFRWMPGMRYWADIKHGYAGCFGRVFEENGDNPSPCNDQWTPLPDLTDPATVGCLLALVREAWGDRGRFRYPSAGQDRASSRRLTCTATPRPKPSSLPWRPRHERL